MNRVLLPEGWPRPKGYSNGVEATGRMVFVAGQIGWTPEGAFEESGGEEGYDSDDVYEMREAGALPQFQRIQDERHRLLEAERCRDGQLRVSRKVAGLIHAIERLRDVRLGTINDVVGSFHHRSVGVVDRDVAGQNQSVVKTFEDVLKGYALLFAE